jgi:hypothetical protein
MENNTDITTLSPVLQDLFTYIMEKAVLNEKDKPINVTIGGSKSDTIIWDCFRNDLTIVAVPAQNALGFAIDWLLGPNEDTDPDEFDEIPEFAEPLTERLLEVCDPIASVTLLRYPDAKDERYDEEDTILDWIAVTRYIELIVENKFELMKVRNRK